jgi:hypothetical protein
LGTMNGENRIPRICGVQGGILTAGNVISSPACSGMVTCIQSVAGPTTQGTCEPGLDGQVCVQQIQNVALTSTFTRGVHFESSSVRIDLEWCPNADCDPVFAVGQALHVIFILDIPNADPIQFTANCHNRRVVETVHNVAEIIIQEAPNLSTENVACGGNTVSDAFAKWEICEVPVLLAGM